MKRITTHKFLSLVLFGMFFAVATSFFTATPVFADTASDKAKEYCEKQYTGSSASNVRDRDACIHAYKKAYNKASDVSGGFCFKYVKNKYSGINTIADVRANSAANAVYGACGKGKLEGLRQKQADDAEKENKAANANYKCDDTPTFFDFGCSGTNNEKSGNENPISRILFTIVSWLTGLVTLAAIGGIIYGGILYASAGDNSGQTQKGISFVFNAVIGLLLWVGMYALLNFIVPGGLFAP